jgi:pimeloyl-ACP methyl ester carboxylesterase
VPDLGESFRSRLRSDVPVLILVGDLDSRTPLENATELLRDLPRGHLIEVANAGHDLNWMQPELRTAWSEFLAGKPVTTTRVAAPAPKFVPLPE